MSNKLPFIPVQPSDMGAEFAGYQYNDAFNKYRNDGKGISNRYQLFVESITKLVYSNFKWYGLKNYEINAIENYLIREGKICAVRTNFNITTQSASGIFFGRPGAHIIGNSEYVDFYGNPLAITCTGYNTKEYIAYTQDDFVIGFDTCAYDKKDNIIPPIIIWINHLAMELDNSYSMWKVACETRKVGMVFQCATKRSGDFLKKVLKKVSENEPYIVIEGEFAGDISTVFAPNYQNQLSEYYMNFMNTWGNVMDLLGLENNSQNKRERLIVSELEMNRSLSRYLAADRLRARKEFASEVNEKFGTNIKVENYLASVVTESPNGANIEGDNVAIGKDDKNIDLGE